MPEQSTVRRLCWIYPERGTAWQRAYEDRAVWDAYRALAKELSLELSLHHPEEVAVDASDPARPRVFLRGEPVTPDDTVFVTMLYALPHQMQDVANQLFLFTVLDRLGFHLPVPPHLGYVVADKAATALHLADGPLPPLPTVRIATGRDAMTGHYDAALAGLQYPLLVKPANWAMGLGISVVANVHDLRGVIALAGGAETALVVQPYVRDPRETRVYVVDGEPRAVVQGWKEGYCGMVNRSLGGRRSWAYTELPERLRGAVEHVARKLHPAPYFTVDFLSDGERDWLSEVELDGAAGFGLDEASDRIAADVVRARFRSYLAGHAAARKAAR
ncbi:ATP-grasp domain-containing protein [Streptomyces toxytricini]|uniref:ATP-grasp domain-containing protein n=1 Tax=Streptomyces toxytricini TaxID=67369 RepID=UPI003434A4BE